MSLNTPLVIQCGASCINVAIFEPRADGRHLLKQLVTEELEYDTSREDDWSFAVVEKIKYLVDTLKLKGKSASLILPGFRLLTKSIKIPHVEESQRAQIIAFEAAQKHSLSAL